MSDGSRREALAATMRSRRPHRGHREESGASLVEFAIILPVFALMLFGMIQFGLAFAGWDQLRNAVQTGARLAANEPVTSPSSNCGQTDPGANMVCQIAFLVGAPLDTSPALIHTSLDIPTSAGCNFSLTSTACTGTNGYAWLDGYYLFHDSQWLQIVNANPSTQEVTDSEAFEAGAEIWTCVSTSGSNCSAIATNVTGQNEGALGSDGVTISVDSTNSQLEVCALRQLISFTSFPGLQDLHISTSSTFYVPAASLLDCPSTAPCAQDPDVSSCG
jgi:Flp pilus assembly pilin Flp